LSLVILFYKLQMVISLAVVILLALAQRQTRWSSIIDGPGDDTGVQVIETADRGFAIIGETIELNTNQRDIYFTKTYPNGQRDWSKRIGGLLFDTGHSLVETSDSSFLLTGYQTNIVANDTIREAVLIRTDSVGNTQNTYFLGEAIFASSSSIVLADDGDYVVAVFNEQTTFLKKINPNGSTVWSKSIDGLLMVSGSPSLIKTPDGGYALTGNNDAPNGEDVNLMIVKTDADGNIEWQKLHGSPINNEAGLSLCNASGEGFGIIGYTRSFGAGLFDMYLLKTDSLGNTLNNFVVGNVFYDLDEDCAFDTGEYGLNDWLLEVVGTDNTYYGLSDEAGNYQIAVAAGDYTLNLISLNDYWQSCVNSQMLSLSGSYDTTRVDFPLQSNYDCPLLEVDISTPFLRRCFENRYTVTYCNDGTVLAADAEVEVDLDEYLNFIDASISDYTNVDNTYTFEIGDIDVGECGQFYIDVIVDCDSTLLGQTHCVEARITPDSICTPPLACWDGGSIELDATCVGDSVNNSQISLGYLTQYFEDDSNPFVSIDCQENVGSWDPNDKRGFPKGYEDQHYIEANTELDYHIRFQNTGSDTAFRIVVRDTISPWLNIQDIQAGASSHPYDFEIYDRNIIKFTFENVNLPDSITDEPGSHGFVKFRIAQQADNPVGTIIYNNAGIYFDYNEPVITNETFHTIGEDYITVSTAYTPVPGVSVEYYPNPINQETTFKITYDGDLTIDDRPPLFYA